MLTSCQLGDKLHATSRYITGAPLLPLGEKDRRNKNTLSGRPQRRVRLGLKSSWAVSDRTDDVSDPKNIIEFGVTVRHKGRSRTEGRFILAGGQSYEGGPNHAFQLPLRRLNSRF